MDSQKIYQFREGVRFFHFDESSFVVDTTGLSLYSLGMSSALISANLDGSNSLSDIMEIVQKYYKVSAEDSETAVMKFISMMDRQGLVQERT